MGQSYAGAHSNSMQRDEAKEYRRHIKRNTAFLCGIKAGAGPRLWNLYALGASYKRSRNFQDYPVLDESVSERPKWLAGLVAACRRQGIPLGRRMAAPPPNGHWPVSFRLRTGETLKVEVDHENHEYLRGWLKPGAGAFVWFETADGCLMGVNLAHAEEIAAEAGAPLVWSREQLTLRFSDGASMRLPKIAGATIDYLQGATIRAGHGAPLYALRCGGETVSLDLASLACVTLPAAWLDEPE